MLPYVRRNLPVALLLLGILVSLRYWLNTIVNMLWLHQITAFQAHSWPYLWVDLDIEFWPWDAAGMDPSSVQNLWKKKIRLAQHALAQEHTFFALQPSCPFCHFLEAAFWYITTLQLCPYVQKWVSYGGLNFSIGDSDMALPIIVACGGSGTMCQPSGADLGHPMQQFEWRLCKQHLAPYAIFSCSSCTWHVFCHILLM